MARTISWLLLAGLTLGAPTLGLATEPGGEREGARPFRMPPQEAQDACAKLQLDAACAFTFDGRAHQGTCRRGPEGQGPIACAPDRGPKGGKEGSQVR